MTRGNVRVLAITKRKGAEFRARANVICATVALPLRRLPGEVGVLETAPAVQHFEHTRHWMLVPPVNVIQWHAAHVSSSYDAVYVLYGMQPVAA